MWNLQTPCTEGSSELISKLLSTMILYNHSSYFKSGEINSCRVSPLKVSRPNIESCFFKTQTGFLPFKCNSKTLLASRVFFNFLFFLGG